METFFVSVVSAKVYATHELPKSFNGEFLFSKERNNPILERVLGQD